MILNDRHSKAIEKMFCIAKDARQAGADAIFEYIPFGNAILYVEIPMAGVVEILFNKNDQLYACIPHPLSREGIMTKPMADISFAGYHRIAKDALKWINTAIDAGEKPYKNIECIIKDRGLEDRMFLEPEFPYKLKTSFISILGTTITVPNTSKDVLLEQAYESGYDPNDIDLEPGQ